MIFCTNCGLAVESSSRFCTRCGAKIVAVPPPAAAPPPAAPPAPYRPMPIPAPVQPAPPPMPMPIPPGNSLPVPPPPRLCTKCGVTLENDTLFCPACGTKNYVCQMNKTRKGELLVALRGCNHVKLQLLKTPGTLFIYDDRIFFQSDMPGNNVLIPYPELTGVSPSNTLSEKLCVKLTGLNGKSYVWSLNECDADFYHYVINLISDYRF